MSKLDGLKQSLGSPHPQPMMEILYEEIFDQYEAQDEIDVVIAYKSHHAENTIEIVDFRVARVNHVYMEGFEGKDDTAYLKAVDAWARSVEGADRYMLIHKHVEGMPLPSDGDIDAAFVLSAIDYARSGSSQFRIDPINPMKYSRRGRFYGMPIVNRHFSTVVPPAHEPGVIDDREIDLGVFDRLSSVLLAAITIAEEAGWVSAAEFRDLIERIRTMLNDLFDAEEAGSDESTIEEWWERVAAEMDEFIRLGLDLHRALAKARGIESAGDVSPEELLSRLQSGDTDGARELLDGMFHAQNLETGVVYKLGPDGVEKVDGDIEEISERLGLTEIEIDLSPKQADPDQFPILGRPAIPAPKQALAADHHEPAPAEQSADRPDVPNAFDGIEIDFS